MCVRLSCYSDSGIHRVCSKHSALGGILLFFGAKQIILMIKMICSFVTSSGQRANLSSRRESNSWPPIHRLGALTLNYERLLVCVGHLLGSYVTRVLYTARISNVRKRHVRNNILIVEKFGDLKDLNRGLFNFTDNRIAVDGPYGSPCMVWWRCY